MYPPSMLSSAALAHSAQELEKRSLCRQLNVNQLISRLQILTRVENVSQNTSYLFMRNIIICCLFVPQSFNFPLEMMITFSQ